MRLLLLFYLVLYAAFCRAQKPKAVHELLTGCPDPYPCFPNYYCTHERGICIDCPNGGINVTEEDCWLSIDFGSNGTSPNATQDLESCLNNCIRAREGEICGSPGSGELECEIGVSFCNFEKKIEVENWDDVPLTDDEIASTERLGFCQACHRDTTECLDDASINNGFGLEECLFCDNRFCYPFHFSEVEEVTANNVTTILSNALYGSPTMTASGHLVKCTNLAYEGETTCEANTDIEGKVCLVEDWTKNTLYAGVVQKCASLGGVGVVLYGDYSDNPRKPNDLPWQGHLSFQNTTIPSVSIPFNDGNRYKQILTQDTSAVIDLSINVTRVGQACFKTQFCSDRIPCAGSSEGRYCNYKWAGEEGECMDCPTLNGTADPLGCFFSRSDDVGAVTGVRAIEDCASVCAHELIFPDCKFCPSNVGGFSFGTGEKCAFCPENDVLYPDREFPLFGEGIYCWQVQKFFETAHIDASSTNCQLAQMMNYVCGCKGEGYAGAGTEAKRAVLAWLPRIMAIISFLGSSYIIYDASKEWRNVMNQLLMTLSFFDVLGSIGYAFTTLPIPKDDPFGPFYGARGNEASCTVQGFAIQMGTISAYINVSLAFYYLLVIKYSWQESRLRTIRPYLFAVPLLIGFAFAFAGIPFYGTLVVWCNNTANYWPDIPVAVAIALATSIMSLVCWDVYKKDKAGDKWRGSSRQGASLSSRVFWQSFWYLMAFYLTWPAYLGLQFSWASGSGFSQYGLTLMAATMVPLQGFWNMIVYVRPRYMGQVVEKIRRSFAGTVGTSAFASSSKRWSAMWSGEKSKEKRTNDSEMATSGASGDGTRGRQAEHAIGATDGDAESFAYEEAKAEE